MSIGSTVLVIAAVIGYFALLPAIVVAFWLDEEGCYQELDYAWRRVYWSGAVVCLLAIHLIYRMSHLG